MSYIFKRRFPAAFRRSIFIAIAIILSIAAINALPNSSPRVVTAQTAIGTGATLPYTELQAEDAATNGTIISTADREWPSLATEASGRKAVTLVSGQSVTFTVPQTTNGLVLRYAIPDAPSGGGITAPLSLYINGVKQPDLSLTSKYSYMYSTYTCCGQFQWSDDPNSTYPGDPTGKVGNGMFHAYDEVHRLLGQTLQRGDTVKLQVDPGNSAPSYTIDLMDFESVPAALGQPAGSLSITGAPYNADPTGVNDSATAIINAVNDGIAQHKVVWIPQGTFALSKQISSVHDVTIQGAGMWYSTLHFTVGAGSNGFVGIFGNYKTGSASQNVVLSDFAIQGEVVRRNDNDQSNAIGGALSNSTIQNIWIEHTKVGMWLDGPMDKLTIKGVRIRDTIADGINFHTGVTNSIVTNSQLRNNGDDALAMWPENQADSNDSFTFNTIQNPSLANGIAIYGGTDISVTDNYVADQDHEGAGIAIRWDFPGSTPFSGTITVDRNTIIRSGSRDYYHSWFFGTGALEFYPFNGSMSATFNVDDNNIIDSNWEAIHFLVVSKSVQTVNFNRVQIVGAGTYALQIRDTGTGIANFSNVTVSGIGAPNAVYVGNDSNTGSNCTTNFTINDLGGNGAWLRDLGCPATYPTAVHGPVATNTPTPTSTPCPGGVCPTKTPIPPTATPTNTPTSTPTPSPVPGTVVKAINAGGGAVNNWVADTNFDLGNQFSDTSTAIDTSGYLDTNPAPQAVYQTCRWNGAFTYTIPGLTAGAQYTVLLHWAELSFQAVGARKFNVAINSVTVLSAFDVYAAAGYKHAISKNFAAVANSSGQIVIAFSQGGADNPFISGIEILSQSGPTATPTRTPTGTTPTFVPPSNTPVTPTNTPVPTGDGSPWNGTPASLPGKVEAENYNTGGEGVAYHDNDTVNNGGQYRPNEGVDIEATTDTGAGYNVGWTNAGEWMKYTVNVTTAGTYNIDFRVASPNTGSTFHLEVDGTNVTGTMTVPNTGGWQTWATITKTAVNLTAGQHVLRWVTDAGGMNYNWINFSSATNNDGQPWNGTPASLPGKVEAENYNTGGEGAAYHDNDTANNGGQYRTSEGVDVEGTSDTGGGYDIGWTNPGEWEKYTVNVTTAGTYTIDFRVASNAAGGSFHLEVDGNNVTGTMSVPVTGGWQTWTTITKTGVSLTAGQHVLRWVIDTAGGSNLNWINFSTGSTPTATPQPTNTQQPLTLVKAINAGGAASGSYVADTNFDTGNQFSDTSTSINTANDPNPAPQSVYQTCRWNTSFTYTIPGLTAGASYTVRLHWAELTWQAAGQRKFNVAVNGSTVLSAFDVFAAGGYKSAVARSFTTTANSSGQIVIAFSQGGADNPFISGIEILH